MQQSTRPARLRAVSRCGRLGRAALLSALSAIAAACVAPQYGPFEEGARSDTEAGYVGPVDASSPGPGPDGAMATPADAGEPLPVDKAWSALVKPNYALRIRFFGRERKATIAELRHEIIMLARMSVDASGRVQMETHRCRDDGYIDSPLGTDKFSWKASASLPVEHFELVWRDGTIRSEAAARAIGFEPEQPASCSVSGITVARPNDAWFPGGMCECRSEPLPVVETDCRLSDPDRDGLPGITVQHTGLREATLKVRALDSCQIVDGVISSRGRISARYIENYDYQELCTSLPCFHNDIMPCPREYNTVVFEPLPDTAASSQPWDCRSLLLELESGTVFPNEMLTFPPTTEC